MFKELKASIIADGSKFVLNIIPLCNITNDKQNYTCLYCHDVDVLFAINKRALIRAHTSTITACCSYQGEALIMYYITLPMFG